MHRMLDQTASHAGPSMNVNEMIARQTRIERQEAANCASVSFERHAANAFQSYVRDALAFSIKRGGILYGCASCFSNTFAVLC